MDVTPAADAAAALEAPGAAVTRRRHRALLYAVLPAMLAAALFLPTIGARTIYLSDEARYALLARNMIESGQWLVPRMGGEVHMEKPPLFMWAIALLSLARGEVTELTAILPAALSGIGGVLATFVLGRRLFGARAGCCAALILATTWGYFSLARMALADMMVTFFIVCGAIAFWRGVERPSARGPVVALYVCLALAVAAKGPAGLAPLLPFAGFLISENGWRALGRLRPLVGLGVGLAVCAPWAIAFAMQRDASYVQTVLLEDYVGPHVAAWDRLTEVFFAAGPLGLEFLPWALLLPIAVGHGYARSDAETRRKFRFLGWWVLTYVVVMTLMAHKRSRYLLPVYPALALMIGWLWDRWMSSTDRRLLRAQGWLWAGFATAVAMALLVPLPLRTEALVLFPVTGGAKAVGALTMLVAGAVGFWACRSGKPGDAFAVVALTMALVLGWEAWTLTPRYNARYDVKGVAARVASHVTAHDGLVAFQSGRLSYDFYLHRPVADVTDTATIRRLLDGPRPLYVLADERAWRTLQTAGVPLRAVEEMDLAGRRVVLGTRPSEVQ